MYGGTELSPALVDRVTELAPVVSARIGQHLYVDRVARASVGRIACVTNSGVFSLQQRQRWETIITVDHQTNGRVL